jgi:hypothetical protein
MKNFPTKVINVIFSCSLRRIFNLSFRLKKIIIRNKDKPQDLCTNTTTSCIKLEANAKIIIYLSTIPCDSKQIY